MIRTLAIAVLTVVFVGVTHGSEAGDNVARSEAEDREAIRQICLGVIERFNKHEPPRAGNFTPEADFVNIYGMWRRDPEEIAKRQGERMATVLKEAKITLIDLRIRFLRPDVALVHQLHEMSGMLTEDGQKMPPHRELGVRVLVKEQGKWLTTAFHNTIVRDAEQRAPAIN
jgi:uncharacterized protein (TIGR02246 family)